MKNIIITGLIVIIVAQLACLIQNDGIIERQRGQLNRCTDTIQELVELIEKVEELEVQNGFLRTNLDSYKASNAENRETAQRLIEKLEKLEESTVVTSSNLDLAAAAILKKDGPAAARDFRDAIEVNIRPALQEELAPVVAAIRHSENGAAGKEYGVLGEGVKRDMKRKGATYRPQAGWAAATVQKTFDRWVEAGKPGTFIEYLGNRYCPVGAENDPTGLNVNWQRNVSKWDATIRG